MDCAEQARAVFIGIPIYGGIDPFFHQSVCKAVEAFNDYRGRLRGCIRHCIGDSAVSRARNVLTRQFLDSDCTHLLFIDSDLVFSLEQIQRIMMHPEDVVGGLYCKKQEGPPQLVVNGCFTEQSPRDNGLLEVRYIGTGFLRVARAVFERMIERWGQEMLYTSDSDGKTQEYNFWAMGVYTYPDGTKRWLSEDWWFCQRCLDLGISVWADTHILMRHSGLALYPLSYQEQSLYQRGANVEGACADHAHAINRAPRLEVDVDA